MSFVKLMDEREALKAEVGPQQSYSHRSTWPVTQICLSRSDSLVHGLVASTSVSVLCDELSCWLGPPLMQVEALQLKLHQLHATDVNTFRCACCWSQLSATCSITKHRHAHTLRHIQHMQVPCSRCLLQAIGLQMHQSTTSYTQQWALTVTTMLAAGGAILPLHNMWRLSSSKQR